MKKVLAPALVLALGAFIQTSAGAAPPAPTTLPGSPVVPGVAQRFQITRVQGEITVPAAFSTIGWASPAALNGFGCANLLVTATSKAQQPNTGGPSIPEWTRSASATGTWASGKCSYTLVVPPASDFNLHTGPIGTDWACDNILISGGTTPFQSVTPKGATKTQNLAIAKVTCVVAA